MTKIQKWKTKWKNKVLTLDQEAIKMESPDQTLLPN